MSNSSMFILGAAAGVAATLFFTSEKTKRVVKGLVDQYDDKLFQISNSLKETVGKADDAVQAGIDKATYKMMI